MSRVELYAVREDGNIVHKRDLANSWLGAMLVWSELGKKYCGGFNLLNLDPVWALQNSPELTGAEWCTLMTTFDDCVVPVAQFGLVAQCYRDFGANFPKSHYAEIANVLDSLAAEGAIGFCANQTSINCNPWWVDGDPDAEDDEGRPYNIHVDSKHWFFDFALRKRTL